MTLPQTWDAYARLQQRLDRARRIDSLTWGLEAGLDALLEDDVSADPDGIRAVATGARRERHQAASRRHRIAPLIERSIETRSQLEARATISAVQKVVSSSDWSALCVNRETADYPAVAVVAGVTAGSLRVRRLRIRRRVEVQIGDGEIMAA